MENEEKYLMLSSFFIQFPVKAQFIIKRKHQKWETTIYEKN